MLINTTEETLVVATNLNGTERGFFVFRGTAEAEAFIEEVQDAGGFADIAHYRQPFQFIRKVRTEQEGLRL